MPVRKHSKGKESKWNKAIDINHFRVAIYGSARIKKNDKNYKSIKELAKRIGEKNIDIITGGGPGTMEAANAGHRAGSKGSTSKSFGLLIRLPREQTANKHLDVKREFKIFSERLDNFVALSNVVVVAPGGIGTLLELFYTWQLVQVKHSCNIPIILLGRQYKFLLKWVRKFLVKRGYVDKKRFGFYILCKQ